MAIDAGTLVSKMVLDIANFSTNMAKTQDMAVKAKLQMDKTFQVGDAMTSFGTSMTKYVSAPLAAIAALAIKVGNEYELQMSRVKAISGATGAEFEKLNKQAIQLGKDTSFSAKEVADGMEELASAGFTANEILGAMPGLMDLTAVSGGNVGLAAEVAATAIRGFGLEATDAGHVADVFARAAADTNAEVSDMGEAMKYIAPVAGAMGLKIEEVAAAIGIMSDAGIKGSQAGTSLRGALSRMAKPTDLMIESMEELGISFYDSEGKLKPLTEQMDILRDATKDLTDEEKNRHLVTLYGQNALSGMLALVESGPDKLKGLTESLENADGAAADMAATMMDNTAMSIEQMLGSFESAAIVIQQILSPAIRGLVDWIGKMVDKFIDASPETQKMIVIFAAVAAAIGPLLVALGTLIKFVASVKTSLAVLGPVFTSLTGPIALVVAAVALIAAGLVYLYKTNENVRKAMQDAWEGIKSAVQSAWEKIKPSLEHLWEAFKKLIKALEPFIQIIAVELALAVTVAVGVLNGMLQAIGPLIDAVASLIDFFGDVIDIIVSLLKLDFKGAFDAWNSACENFGKVFENVFIAIGEFLKGFWEGFKGTADTFLKAIGTSLDEVVDDIKTAWSNVGKWFSDLGTTISEGFSTMSNDIGNWFSKAWDNSKTAWSDSKEWFGDLVTGIGDWFTKLSENVDAATKLAAEGFKLGWEVIKEFFSELWESVLDIFSGFVEGIKQHMDNVKENLSGTIEGIQGIFSALGDFFTNYWEMLKLIFLVPILLIADLITGNFDGAIEHTQKAWEKFKEYFVGMWEAIKEVVGGIIDTLTTFIKEVFISATTHITQTWTSFKDKVIEIANSIKVWVSEKFNEMVDNVKKFVSDLIKNVSKYFTDMWDNVKATATKIKDSVTTAFQNMYTAVVNKVREIWQAVVNKFNEILTWLRNLPSKLYNIAVDMFTRMASGVRSSIANVKSAITNGINSAITSITALPGKAWGWASDFIGSFAQGIYDSVHWVIDSVKYVADTITSWLHFTRPDVGPLREYEQWMPHMMQGFGKTLEKAVPAFMEQVKGITHEMEDILEGQEYSMNVGAEFGAGKLRYGQLTPDLEGDDSGTVVYETNVNIERIEVRDDDDLRELSQNLYDREASTFDAQGSAAKK